MLNNNNLFDKTKPRNLRSGSWIRTHEFEPFTRILLWATGTKDDRVYFDILVKRIKKMYDTQGKRNNLKQVYLYLKECYTICVSVITGSSYNPKMRVAVGKVSGFPLIIPGRLRKRMRHERSLYIATMTLLGIHRIIPWWPPISYHSITEKFNGKYKTLAAETLIESKRKLCELAGVSDIVFSKLKSRTLLPESAGSNTKVSWKGAIADCAALIAKPDYLWHLIKWLWMTKSYAILASLIATSLLVWPLTLSFTRHLDGSKKRRVFNISRLTAVYNTAGKARLIAITNYWVQVALYPLHREIFKFLKGIPTDGTYDQLKPVKALVENGQKYFSFDLTAATDRLPREIQRDVLELFVGKALSSCWYRLMDMPFRDHLGDEIRYSVGQPMGAYTSWAMLALTHHMIVQASGPKTVENYAVLGDDVIVSEDAPDYLAIMTGLGLEISLSKSIISSEFVEFAKRVRTLKGEDFSIVGPGLIQSAVRNRYLSAVVLADSLRKGLLSWTVAPQVLSEMPGKNTTKRRHNKVISSRMVLTGRSQIDFGSWVLFGPKGLISSNLSFALSIEGGVRVIEDLKHESVFFKSQIRRFLEKEILRKFENSKKIALNVLNNRVGSDTYKVLRNKWGWSLGLLAFLAQWTIPTHWHILSKYGKVLESVSPIEEREYHKMYIDDIILDAFDGFPEIEISTLDPLTRKEANNIVRFYDGLLSYDHDLLIIRQNQAARKEWLERVEIHDRHQKLVAELASSRNARAKLLLYSNIRAHGHTVPQHCEDNLNTEDW